jgi:hypothetical protein
MTHPKKPNKKQANRFIRAAREHGVSEHEAVIRDELKRIVEAKSENTSGGRHGRKVHR